MFDVKPLGIAGCYELQPKVQEDLRGKFVKVFHANEFELRNLEVDFNEEYYSSSTLGVVRGMHFQTPPFEHVKLIYCPHGEVFDVVVDLRRGSPTYGQSSTLVLSSKKGNCIYIPKGLAHGFCATSLNALLVYKVSTVYSPESDTGILWSSIDVDWPITKPILSTRDSSFSSLSDFESPFVYEY
jgi:dTDP-4-dehydrorhamnose 3,5-epimerase